jgi:hypothetical protein
LDKPENDQIEISVFGPGYGESIALHIGNGKWLVVDSCVDKSTNNPAVLDYFNRIGVDPSKDVSLVVITHWHQDHIKGIGNVLQECERADVCISSAFASDEFLTITGLFGNSEMPRGSGLDEMFNMMNQLHISKEEGKSRKLELATTNKLILNEELLIDGNSYQVSVYTLYPNDKAHIEALRNFGAMAKNLPEKMVKTYENNPNISSVVLLIEIDGTSILFGGDLEETADSETGWSSILAEKKVGEIKSSSFKIPHHGSRNAHNDDVWKDLLDEDPFSVLTPYQLGSRYLPSAEDISRIKKLSSNLFTTSHPEISTALPIDKIVREKVKAITKDFRSMKSGFGHVRLRKNLGEGQYSWSADLFGDAKQY